MRKDRLNELLDSIYELEGLVHLALTRDDEPAKLTDLIIRKVREMSDRASMIVSDAQPEKRTLTIAEAAAYEEEQDSGIDIPEETVGQASFDDEGGYTNINHDDEESMDVIDHVDDVIDTPEPETVPEPLPEQTWEPEPEQTWEPEPEQTWEPEKPEQKQVSGYKFDDNEEPRGRLVFSINDRYRFRRELFNNNDAAFNTTLSLVASMDGYEEAEDYFLNELQWNEASPEVIDFLEILKKYFK